MFLAGRKPTCSIWRWLTHFIPFCRIALSLHGQQKQGFFNPCSTQRWESHARSTPPAFCDFLTTMLWTPTSYISVQRSVSSQPRPNQLCDSTLFWRTASNAAYYPQSQALRCPPKVSWVLALVHVHHQRSGCGVVRLLVRLLRGLSHGMPSRCCVGKIHGVDI